MTVWIQLAGNTKQSQKQRHTHRQYYVQRFSFLIKKLWFKLFTFLEHLTVNDSSSLASSPNVWCAHIAIHWCLSWNRTDTEDNDAENEPMRNRNLSREMELHEQALGTKWLRGEAYVPQSRQGNCGALLFRCSSGFSSMTGQGSILKAKNLKPDINLWTKR